MESVLKKSSSIVNLIRVTFQSLELDSTLKIVKSGCYDKYIAYYTRSNLYKKLRRLFKGKNFALSNKASYIVTSQTDIDIHVCLLESF